jgi:hypothetical protein
LTYNKYNIKETEKFEADHFPKMQFELEELASSINDLSPLNRENIVISFTKGHSLKKDWADSNPELTKNLSDGQYTTTHLESLFESGKQNKQFTAGFEEYIRNNLGGNVM